ncbi:MAG: amidohydrolase [Micropepsaceae bacterium]
MKPALAETCSCCTPPLQGLYRASRRQVLAGAAISLATPRLVCAAVPNPSTAPDTIFLGATVRTMNLSQPVAEAIAVKNGRIVAVGKRSDIAALKGTGTEVIDANGATILPGFIDPHVHIVMAAALSAFTDVRALVCETMDEVTAKLKAAVAAAAPGAWIMAKGFDPSITKGNANVTRRELDAIAPANPVFMLNASGHLAYVNTKALDLAGLTEATPDPGAGGKYFKDANGKLTGVVAGGSAYPPFIKLMPRATPEGLLAATTAELSKAAKVGCTMLVDAGLGAFAGTDELAILKAIVGQGKSPVRLAAMMTSARIDEWLKMPGIAPGAGDDWFRLLGFKFWSDGSNQGNTGYQRERYLNVDSKGVLSFPAEVLAAGVKRAHDAGWQVAIHANGDAAIDVTLDAYEQALKANPRNDHRHRIEHCSIAWDEHYAKMAALGLTPSFLIGHVHYWGKAFRDRIIGPERAARLGAGASAMKAGVRFSLHSDYDVTEIGPLRCIENAVTRIMRDGGEVLAPEQRIPIDQALRAMTIDAAYQARMDHAIGTLEVGKYADLVVLEEDPLKIDPTRLSQINIRETWVEGVKRFG